MREKKWVKRVLTVILGGIAAAVLSTGVISATGLSKIAAVEAADRTVTFNSVTIQGENVVANVSCSSLPSSDDGKFYLYADQVYQDGCTGEIVASADRAESAQFVFPLNLNTASSNLSKKFIVAVKRGGSMVQVSNEHYITNPEAVATHTVARNDHGIKGILPDQSKVGTTELQELGVQQAIYNMYLENLCGPTTNDYYPTIDFAYEGQNYQFNGAIVNEYDTLVTKWNSMGIQVTMVILNTQNSTNSAAADLIHPDSQDGHDCPGYAFNTDNAAGTQHLKAIAAFLGERYSGTGHGTIDNWIVGNEVNARTEWYYLSSSNLDVNVSSYVKAFRIFYNGFKSQNGNANIYNSIDQEWNRKSNPGSFLSKDYLDRFNYYILREGNIDWDLSFHPYNAPLFDPYAWKGQAQYLSTSITTPYITMQNLNILVEYMHNAEFLAPNGQCRRISLAELGYTSEFGEQYQNASIIYAYLMATTYPEVDAFMLFRETDNAHEMESHLALGLNNVDGSHKSSFYVYKALGTSNQQTYLNEASATIGTDIQALVNSRTFLTRGGWFLND
ncbi:MAG: hypothetical protein K6A23_00350 [Butyrivibrio sp.]|nr:hypothetical protein [Butyrivibrio sp.]